LATLLRWIRNHDESWLFVGIYIGFAVVLSVMLSLFWLVLMVGIHFIFELIRQARHHRHWSAIASKASWEIRVDVALLLLAFAVTLYMDLIVAILGLQSLGRAAVATSRVGTRAVAWQRAVRAVVLGFDDVANGIRAILMKKGSASSAEASPKEEPELALQPAVATGQETATPTLPGWGHPWSFWDRATMGLCAACLVAMMAAPPLTGSSFGEAAQLIREELRPFPEPEEDIQLGSVETDRPGARAQGGEDAAGAPDGD
jgi:hypothetical protein